MLIEPVPGLEVLTAERPPLSPDLLGVFVATVLYFVAVYHLTNLYIARQHEVERFLLWGGGIYPALFWLGQTRDPRVPALLEEIINKP